MERLRGGKERERQTEREGDGETERKLLTPVPNLPS